nr:ATP-binding protein [Actinopolymorpha rutila]
MDRETLLAGYGWAVDVDGLGGAEARVLLDQLSRLVGPVVVVGQVEASDLTGTPVRLPRLTAAERTAALAGALDQAGAGSAADPAEVARVAGVFDLDWDALPRVAAEVAGGEPLWSACRRAGRTAYGRLAQVRSAVATWDDLVLPALPRRQLGALCAAVRQRHRVLGDWGFADRGDRGLGTTALFSGPSGTGKTLAAEVIAGDLGLDLVHVDLSQVVSKYIGESEKHLAALFDAAEGGGAVLLFDEADALFGKRSEVRDSHDRYANLEVGYLLQRMEAFRGLAVLTTNARSVLDPAFLRRVHTVVAFPYPDAELRAALWRRAFPDAAPTDGIDPARLAAIDLPGGGIAAAALTAAYLAAEESSPITTRHVTEAARWELAKSGRTLAALPERRAGHA